MSAFADEVRRKFAALQSQLDGISANYRPALVKRDLQRQARKSRRAATRTVVVPETENPGSAAAGDAVVTAAYIAADAVVTAKLSQTFGGASLASSVLANQYLLGDGTNGTAARFTGTIDRLSANAQIAVPLLHDITFRVENFTTNDSADVTLNPGETFARVTNGGIAVSVGDEIGIFVQNITGVGIAACDLFNVRAVLEP